MEFHLTATQINALLLLPPMDEGETDKEESMEQAKAHLLQSELCHSQSAVAGDTVSRLLKIRPLWAMVACSAALVALSIGTVTFLVFPRDQQLAERLLAQAYTKNRTIEVRIPKAQYAPMQVERELKVSSIDKPFSLLQAEAIIGEHLYKHPDDSIWLQYRARADLLDGNYESAIKSLNLALESPQNKSSLQIDLASAYYLRGLGDHSSADYGDAVDLLDQVLQDSPNNAIALFNRAIILEHLYLFDQSVKDWAHYLDVDPTGNWRVEASRELQRVAIKRKTRDYARLDPLLDPVQVAVRVALNDPQLRTTIEGRIEEYERVAVRNWLQEAYPIGVHISQDASIREKRRAIRLIAGIARVKHGDEWLSEILTASSLSNFPAAVHQLARAIIASENAEYAKAYEAARESSALFSNMHNTAGVSRAQFEEVYALQFSKKAPECARQALRLADAIKQRSFQWLSLQTQIERGICEILVGDYGGARHKLQTAETGARHVAYPSTQVRAITMLGLLTWSEGDKQEAWNDLEHGLAICWDNECPMMPLYSLYANMDDFAEDSQQWHLEVTLAEQALTVLGDDPDSLMRAVENNRLAKAAILANYPDVAAKHFAIADDLIKNGPKSREALDYEAVIQIDLAKLAARRKDSTLATNYLDAAAAQLDQVADQYVLIDYFETLGEAQLERSNFADATNTLQKAASLAEVQLASLRSGRDRLAWRQVNDATYHKLVEAQLRRHMYLSAFATWEWFLCAAHQGMDRLNETGPLNPSYATDVHKGNHELSVVPMVSSIAQRLATLDDRTVVSFVIESGKVGVWVADDRGVVFSWVDGRSDEIVAQARRFVRLCSYRNSDLSDLTVEGHTLYARLLRPIATHLSTRRTLVFDGDEDLAEIPFDALVDDRGRYLADSYATTNMPGLLYVSPPRTANALNAAAKTLIVTAASASGQQGASPYPLPEVVDEASMIAQKFRDADVIPGVMSPNGSFEMKLHSADIFHFAGHSVSVKQEQGLALAMQPKDGQDRIFSASRIFASGPSRLKLAVLSACSTESAGRGINDPNGLTSALIEMGVPHVVASRWDVDSATTTRFMDAFYDALLQGQSVPMSVRYAGSQIRSLPSTALPYYWAAFASFGQP